MTKAKNVVKTAKPSKPAATGLSLTKTRILAGVYEGVLFGGTGSNAPAIEVSHLDQVLEGVSVTPLTGAKDGWTLRVPIPAALLTDGVQTFVIHETDGGTTLGTFAIVTGEPLEDDIRAEVDLLRAELDILKKAFRRHCKETGS